MADRHVTNNFYAPIGQHIDHVDHIDFYMDGDGTFHFNNVCNNRKADNSETPAELQTEEAHRLWDAARDAGWVDDDCQPLLSRPLSALLADRMATLLNIQNKWKVFETFWNRKNMRSDYNDALNQKQFDEFYEKLKKTIN